MAYRKIPRKLVISGNVALGKTFIGRAEQELVKLENELRLSQFPEVQQMHRTRDFGNVVIECWTAFGLSTVKITTKGGAENRSKMCQECMCGCHVSVGVVAYTEKIDCIEHITNLHLTYDVIVCQKKTRYIELTGCQPVDFTRYRDGDLVYVLWVPDSPMTYADNMKAGCVMETSSWGRILPFNVLGGKFIQKPC